MNEFVYISGGIDIIDQLALLWSELNDHHISVSKHFSAQFESFTFETRVSSLKQKSIDGKVFILIAKTTDSNLDTGYCISSINQRGEGEIDSIYIRPKFRGNGIARNLMDQSLHWLKSNHVKDIRVGVVHGNEDTYQFYSKFGFFPKVTILQKISD